MSGAGDAGGAVQLLESCLARVREEHAEDSRAQARYAITLSYAHADAGQYAAAATLLGEVMREGGEDIDLPMRATVYYALARLHNSTGQLELALGYARQALDLRRQTGEEWYEGNCHVQVANLLLTAGADRRGGRPPGPRPAPVWGQDEHDRRGLPEGGRGPAGAAAERAGRGRRDRPRRDRAAVVSRRARRAGAGQPGAGPGLRGAGRGRAGRGRLRVGHPALPAPERVAVRARPGLPRCTASTCAGAAAPRPPWTPSSRPPTWRRPIRPRSARTARRRAAPPPDRRFDR